MNCNGCGGELHYNYYLKLCDGCLEKRYRRPFPSKVHGRFFIFRTVGAVLAPLYLFPMFASGLENPIQVVPVAVSWAMVSAFISIGLHLVLYEHR